MKTAACVILALFALMMVAMGAWLISRGLPDEAGLSVILVSTTFLAVIASVGWRFPGLASAILVPVGLISGFTLGCLFAFFVDDAGLFDEPSPGARLAGFSLFGVPPLIAGGLFLIAARRAEDERRESLR